MLGGSLLLGSLGLSQYLWLILRARAGADWIYGQPGSLRGAWDEIVGAEAAVYIGLIRRRYPPCSRISRRSTTR